MLASFGNLYPLVLDSSETEGTGLMNPSIIIIDNKIYCNIRHTNYTLFHSEKKLFHHQYGPLQYIHPEDDMHLRTNNFICILNNNYNIESCYKIDTSQFDKEPLWDFVGLEDGRLVYWDNKIYLTGVRRDTTINGQGRMELSEINVNNKEINRFRIPTPFDNDTYCEKNWMPILDKPYHYIKWSNPTELVKYDPINCITIQSKLNDTFIVNYPDFRGGSQVISFIENESKYYLAITHEVWLFNNKLGRKDGKYMHRFLLWDDNFNLIKISDAFSFMNGEIEFCCGIAIHNNNCLITFGFQDNAAYLLEIEFNKIKKMFFN